MRVPRAISSGRALSLGRRVAALSLVSLLGCEGFAGPIVGVRPTDGGLPTCREAVACRPWRTVPAERFVPPAWSPPVDCDLDGVPDDLDNCPGVPNAWQEDVCAAARAWCARLEAGEDALDEADLRGCRAVVPLPDHLDLAGADLSCSRLRIDGEGSLVMSGARVTGATIELHGPRVVADDLLLVGSSVTLAAGATLGASRVLVERSRVRLEPSQGAMGEAVAALDLSACDVRESVIEEADATRPGRVRLDECDVVDAHLVGPAIEGVLGDWDRATLDATDLLVLGTTLRRSVVRATYVAFAGVSASDVVFATCGTITFSGCRLRDVDVPPCAPAGLTLEGCAVDVCRMGGGLRMIGGVARESVLGAPGASIETVGADLTHVRFCAPARGRFLDGSLTCSACGDGDFGEGLCRRGPRRTSEHCPPLQHAPACTEDEPP